MTDQNRAARAASEVARINAFFPIMPLLGNRWAASRPFEGLTISISAHLTTLTAALARELALGGGTWVYASASEATTNHGVVEYLRDNGLAVHTGGDRDDHHEQVLGHGPDLIADVGASLIETLVRRYPERAEHLRGAVEITKSGIDRLSAMELPFGVLNINDGRLKPTIENRHGVGDGLWHSVRDLTGMHLAGRKVGVVGYGSVGKGVAAYARALGAHVEVIERDAIRSLIAKYDGFPAATLPVALARNGIIVTCTGGRHVVDIESLRGARDGIVLVNAGHGGDEFDVVGIKAAADAVDHVADHVVKYRLEGGPSVVLLADGHPLNIVTNSGSPEPVLLHFAVLGLALEWLARNELAPGLASIPRGIEEEAAALALRAHAVAHG